MALDTLLSNANTPLSLTVLAIALVATAYFYAFARPTFAKNTPPYTSETWPIIGSMQFFTQRWSFFQRQMAHSSSGNFSFHVGDKQVVALSGDESRRVFFDSKSLGFTEGYAALLGGSPTVEQKGEDGKIPGEDDQFSNYFSKRLIAMLKGPLLAKGLPQLLEDVRFRLDELVDKKDPTTDPFDSIYRIVFQLTMRTVACNEIAGNPELLEKVLGLYETIENTASAWLIMYPWLPTPSKFRRTYAGAQLYMIFKNVVDARTKEDRREEDALQYLMDQGDDITKIITCEFFSRFLTLSLDHVLIISSKVVLGALFAGQLNSGINAAWILVYLTHNSLWRHTVLDEVNSIADKYNADKSLPLKERLMTVPISAWESEFPMIDLCLKDSIRLQMSGTAFRKNTSGKPISLDKEGREVIPTDAYVTYAVGDIHYNPEIYSQPDEWDPSRYLPERQEDKKKQYGWIGWGVSRHPCLGMRFAKLENNIITAFFLAYFEELELLGKDGQAITPPHVNRDNHSAKKPDGEVRIRYKVRGY